MKFLATIILFNTCLNATAQVAPTRGWMDSEVKFTDSAGRGITVQSSFPKGGGTYFDSAGKKYSYVIFWISIRNETGSSIDLSMNFPSVPLNIFPLPEAHIRLFLPPDPMTPDKIQLRDYGLDLQAFLTKSFHQSGRIQRTIGPREEFLFYIPVLFNQPQGTTRAAVVIKEQDLLFKIRVSPEVDGKYIPFGKLVFRN